MLVWKLSWTSFGGSTRSWWRGCKHPVSNIHQHSRAIFSSNLQWSFHAKGELSLQGSNIHSWWHSHSFRVWAPRIQCSWSRIRDMDQKEDWSRGEIWPFCRRAAATPERSQLRLGGKTLYILSAHWNLLCVYKHRSVCRGWLLSCSSQEIFVCMKVVLWPFEAFWMETSVN